MILVEALRMAFYMLWEIFWALCLGFLVSAAVQAVVSKAEMSRLLPDASPRSLLTASALGAASSSCSYAAVAIAKSLIKKGADFTASMAFEFASTNLVIEIGVLLLLLLGWQFVAAQFLGGILMVFLLALIFRMFLPAGLVDAAKRHLDKGLPGKMEGHAAMDMAVDPSKGSILKRLLSPEGVTAVSHYFVMDVVSVWTDIAIGLFIAGALSAWVPNSFWQSFFLVHSGRGVQSVWGALVGPLVSMASFVCSVGNVPLALVLWKGGISFGGVIAFIFADLIIPPILNIYRKYYGPKMTVFLFVSSYVAMAGAGLIIEACFGALGLIPKRAAEGPIQMAPTLNYTAVLNCLFLILAALMLVRFLRTGGPEMLAMMEEPGDGGCHSSAKD